MIKNNYIEQAFASKHWRLYSYTIKYIIRILFSSFIFNPTRAFALWFIFYFDFTVLSVTTNNYSNAHEWRVGVSPHDLGLF